MIQSWENLVTDKQTDGQMDVSNFIWRCPTNIEHPKHKKEEENGSKIFSGTEPNKEFIVMFRMEQRVYQINLTGMNCPLRIISQLLFRDSYYS